jgi:hypothetical protein
VITDMRFHTMNTTMLTAGLAVFEPAPLMLGAGRAKICDECVETRRGALVEEKAGEQVAARPVFGRKGPG